MNQWKNAAVNYEKEMEINYTRLRSYLTIYQFRLPESQKHEIREMLSQFLDDIEKMGAVDDFDNYLDGFCFKLDKSVMPTFTQPKPTNVKIAIAPEECHNMKNQNTKYFETSQPSSSQGHFSDNQPSQSQLRQEPSLPELDQKTVDSLIPVNFDLDTDLADFYTLQFMQ